MSTSENIFIFSLLFPFLYAETHYRFKYFISWLKKSEPEIIADIPSRIEKGKELPVLLIVKDSDKYNTEIFDIKVYENDKEIFSQGINLALNQPYFDKIFFIDTSGLEIGKNYIDIEITYKIKDKTNTCRNDNHRGTKHKPLPVFVSDNSLPKFDNCVFGETHSHTNYTSDQLEFGASIKSTSVLAEAMGLNFFCATDHSYDLDDDEHNYLLNNSELPKWKNLQKEIISLNKSNQNFKVIAGEEASLHNHKSRNIHCLIYNSEKFYPGKGDSGEKWLHPFSELTIENVLDDVDENTLVFAAHPVEPVPFLQRILIRRDNWHEEDCKNPRLNGLQFANGGPKKYFDAGKKLWINLLLQGHKLTGIAGNDAHGNFARYRQVSFPFIKMEENYFHLFGDWRTGVYLDSSHLETDSILKSLKAGNCFITNGPAIKFEANCNNEIYSMGSYCHDISELNLNIISSQEFGKISNYMILQGTIGESQERVIFSEQIDEIKFKIEFNKTVNLGNANGYVRCEVQTHTGKIALSNPIWYK